MNDWNPQSGPPSSEKERFAPSEEIQAFNTYYHYTSLSRTEEKVSTASACSSVDSYVGSTQYSISVKIVMHLPTSIGMAVYNKT